MEVNGRHQIQISQTYLEYTEGSSNKFYRTLVIENKSTNRATLICTYGPIGRAGTDKVTHSTGVACHSEATKKIAEKERKGYIKAKPKHISIGTAGNLVAHTFGEDKLKDREAWNTLEIDLGKLTLNEIAKEGNWDVTTETAAEAKSREKREAEAAAKAKAEEEARLQAIENERSANYDASWGLWG